MSFELLPLRAVDDPSDPVLVEVRDLPAPGRLTVRRLGEPVAELPVAVDGVVTLGALSAGGYGIELIAGDRAARTAVEVAGDGVRRLRYGFVTDYRPGRDLGGVTDNIRRLHLTDVQFYDWAYRHADLLGGGEVYHDALGQPISLASVRGLVDRVHAAGARALGYAAVYGVSNDEWARWSYAALLTPSGQPYGLGDFLRLVDPADPGWREHFLDDLRAATERLGFDGFHLDQYGYPKHATRPDGTAVAVEDSFVTLIEAARAALPDRRLVFNNVNDFPVWRTGTAPQDAMYIEVWPPHTTLNDLAAVVRKAHHAGAGKPVVIAAYQHVYDTSEVDAADRAAAFTMATLFSHGASHLLCGEADRILVDPYYVRNHVVEASTAALLKRWYDFLVEHIDLLHDPALQDMTGALAGAYNDDCDVTYAGLGVTSEAAAGCVWRRIHGAGDRLILHLINLVGQDDTDWDAPRKPVASLPGGTLRIRRSGPDLPRVRVADPDLRPSLHDLPVTDDGDHAVVRLPSPHIWQLIVIDLNPSSASGAISVDNLT
ncbi:MAG TPA: glycoside hydrolase family 66 protein, partial [Micromonosporaceae bacterium]